MNTPKSSALFNRAMKVIPGGVNSPVRAFGQVHGTPIFIHHGDGPYIIDEDGQRYVDYVGSWGPLILGHNHPQILHSVQAQCKRGLSFGASCENEVIMAETLCRLVPSMDRVRLVNSGTEATMSAIRLARAFTNRDKVIKFEGCYHGHSDALLVKAGSGALTCGTPSSPGIPSAFTEHTLTAQFNDLNSVVACFEANKNKIAALIVEPVAGNMNMILPQPGFLEGLRQLCDQNQTLLIFDEVMTGFRVTLGGAQDYYQVQPDLTTLGKVIGAGLPVGAFGGRHDIMTLLAPEGPVYQAGTLSGNPIAIAAGLAQLQEIQKPGFYQRLSAQTEQLVTGICQLAKSHKIALQAHSLGGMFGLFFSAQPVTDYQAAIDCNQTQFQKFFHAALAQGLYFAPSMYEAGFVSSAHDDAIIQQSLEGIAKALISLQAQPA